MKPSNLILLLFTFALLLAVGVFAQSSSHAEVLLEVPVAPIPIIANHKAHLLYELHLTNIGQDKLELIRLEVWAGQRANAPLATYHDTPLGRWFRRPGLAGDLPNKRLVGGGLRAVVFVNVTTDVGAVPSSLNHKLFFKAENGNEVSAAGAPLIVRRASVALLRAPLRGDGWVALNGLGAASHHRLSFLARDGKAVVPQRYGIDWVRLGAEGKLFRENPSENKNYYGYGAEALAVGDATVAEMREGLPDLAPFTASKSGASSFDNSTGNYVLLNLGNSRFALYAHLQPGSVRVKRGERIRAGQVLGLIGSSGASDVPHLHFHVVDAGHRLLADGLPYVFHSFVVQGNAGSLDALFAGKGVIKRPAGGLDQRNKELPEDLDVVSFP